MCAKTLVSWNVKAMMIFALRGKWIMPHAKAVATPKNAAIMGLEVHIQALGTVAGTGDVETSF